jgi:ADP-glucose pyrophosphorylase
MADIGTIRAFYETNLLLTGRVALLLIEVGWPINTQRAILPGSEIENSQISPPSW